MARGLGQRLLEEIPGNGNENATRRIRRGFELCFSRAPTEKEEAILAQFQKRQAAGFQKDSASSAAVAPAAYPNDFSPAEAASWVSLARALINTDEFITRE